MNSIKYAFVVDTLNIYCRAVVSAAEVNKMSRDAAFLHHLTHKSPSESPTDKFI